MIKKSKLRQATQVIRTVKKLRGEDSQLTRKLQQLSTEDIIHLSGYITGIALITVTPSDYLSNEIMELVAEILD